VRAPARPRRSPLGTDVAELLWLRSMTSSRHLFLASARDGRSVSYGQLRAAVERWSALLQDLAVPPGGTVGMAIADPLDFTVVFFGVLASGRVAAPLDPSATDAEIAAVCSRVSPRVVLSDRPAPSVAAADASGWRGGAPEWVTMPEGSFHLTGAVPAGEDVGAGPFAGGVVLSTSGTTGTAKVVRLDERRMLHTARAVAAAHELSAADRGFSPLPLFHINAEVVGLLATLVAGATLVVDDRFHRRGFWETIGRCRVTWINAVPAVLAHLSTLHEGEAVPPGVRFARSASAPLPVPVLERFQASTGIMVVETYGMTEAASQIAANPLHGRRKAGSVGLPVATEVRIVPDGARPGRVLVRGPGVIAAYASPGHDDRFDADGWLETGDLGYLDEDGYLFLVGRADDVINRGGEKVHPKEVEDVVGAEPGVAEVAVVGWDHQALGQVPVAYLVLDPREGPWDSRRAEALVARVCDRCTRALSRPKRPVAFHVVESLPHSATGKVRRRQVTGCHATYTLLVR
jgi:acyl-CoA synthetase (AMP-forming)/AMP-acid ligase II